MQTSITDSNLNPDEGPKSPARSEKIKLVAYDPYSPDAIAAARPKIRLVEKKVDVSEDEVVEAVSKVSTSRSARKRRKLAKEAETKTMNKVVLSENVVLIKPQIDASDKEIHMRNQFGHTSKNLLAFIQQSYKRSDFDRQVFKPRRLGELTKNNQGEAQNVQV